MMAAAAARSTGMVGKKARKPYTITRPRERWSADEHDRFLHALALFGRDWKRIEALVGTKTSTQIKSHAQKHFLKVQKLGFAAPPPQPRRAAVLDPPPVRRLSWFTGDMTTSGEMLIQLPLSPDDPYFAQVYRFIGDIFGCGGPRPIDTQLQRLVHADAVIVGNILRVLANFEENLSL